MIAATSETNRPVAENNAIETSGWSSDLFGDVDETGIDAAMRVAFGMFISPMRQ
jgi:hypothetical protein